jgi:hypothetical protein
MANDEEMFVLFEDFEKQRRQFYYGQSPFTNITENCFQKHFRLTKNLSENVISIVEPFFYPQTCLFGYGHFFCPLYGNLGEIKDPAHFVVILPNYFFGHC